MKEVVQWLEQMFIHDNHNKYIHLYKEWSRNLTNEQLVGFKLQMERYNKTSKV